MKTNPRHEKFIEEMIQHGDRARAYKAAYPESASVYSSAYRLANNPDIASRIQQGLAEKQMREDQAMEEEYHRRMAGITQKRNLLSKIINSEIRFEKMVKSADGYEPVNALPTPSDILKAIELDNKLAKEMGLLNEKVKFRITIGGREFR